MQLLWAFEYRCYASSKGGEVYHNENWTARKVGQEEMGGGFDDFAFRGP